LKEALVVERKIYHTTMVEENKFEVYSPISVEGAIGKYQVKIAIRNMIQSLVRGIFLQKMTLVAPNVKEVAFSGYEGAFLFVKQVNWYKKSQMEQKTKQIQNNLWTKALRECHE
jgi:hypothetical protein